MKSHITVIVVACVAVVGLAVGIFTAHPLESAQTRLDRQINEQVDIAQRMLLDYRPITAQLSMHLGPAATQPADVPSDQWQADVAKTQQEGPASAGLRELAGRVQKVNSRFGQIEGGTAAHAGAPASGTEAYRNLQTNLKYNDRLLADALQIVQQAINMSDGEHTGSSHPGATRLEAVLCYHRADQFRREAAFYRAEADEAQARFMQDVTWWRRSAADIASTERELDIVTTQPASAPASQAVASAPASAAASEAVAKAPASGPAIVEPKPGEAPAEAATAEATPVEPAAAKAEPALPPIDDRIARLQQHKREVIASTENIRAEAAQLTQAKGQLERRIAVASREADDAEQQMLKLQQNGVDPSDPAALKRFTEAYEKAATADRAAYREKTILQQGSLRDARVNSSDEDEILNKPLAPAQPGGQVTTERGLVAIEGDLKAAEAVVTGQTAVAKEITRQVDDLTARKKEASDRVAALKAAQERVGAQLTQSAKAALAATIEALRFEKDGLDMAQTRGLQAAKRAQRALEGRIGDAQKLNAERGGDSQNPRLLLISKDMAGTGHALALIGDLHLLAAQIEVEQAETHTAQARLLQELQRLGVPVDAKLLPEGATAGPVPAEAVKLDAAKAAAQQARTAALEAAKQALDAYTLADTPLQQLWVLHANMATVHHLMANLTTGKESTQHANDARIEYLRAMKGREERPEVPTLQSALASLTTRPAK